MHQLNLFPVPAIATNVATIEPAPLPASSDGGFECDNLVRQALNRAIKANPMGRDQIAERLSVLVGRKITKAMLDTFTGAGRPNRLPAELLPALTAVLGPVLLDEIARVAGCRVLESEEVQFARLGQAYILFSQMQHEVSENIDMAPLFSGVVE